MVSQGPHLMIVRRLGTIVDEGRRLFGQRVLTLIWRIHSRIGGRALKRCVTQNFFLIKFIYLYCPDVRQCKTAFVAHLCRFSSFRILEYYAYTHSISHARDCCQVAGE